MLFSSAQVKTMSVISGKAMKVTSTISVTSSQVPVPSGSSAVNVNSIEPLS